MCDAFRSLVEHKTEKCIVWRCWLVVLLFDHVEVLWCRVSGVVSVMVCAWLYDVMAYIFSGKARFATEVVALQLLLRWI